MKIGNLEKCFFEASQKGAKYVGCILYTSDAADEQLCVWLCGSRYAQCEERRSLIVGTAGRYNT